MARRTRVLALLAVPCILGAAGAAGTALFLQAKGVSPRALAPYVEKRSSGHNGAIVGAGQWAGTALRRLDRGQPADWGEARLPAVGAQAAAAQQASLAFAGERMVASAGELRAAVAAAKPGDVITLLPGHYRIERAAVAVNRPGSAEANIVLRAQRPGTVAIDVDSAVGFAVSAPYWRFENLQLRGVCKVHSWCEHAFHVTGGASHFAALNNTIADFNAHFKINGHGGKFPDHGRIEGNTLRNDSVRATANPVTPIDIVAASDWSVRRNLIADFIKGSGNRISYGAFAKGAGSGNLFEQNVVLCEARLRGAPGQRVGLSLGGGATGAPYCRDGKCIVEQERGVLRANLIANCSDDGIYLNNAAASRIEHNTLLDTGGVQVRFAGSSADIEGNLIDGAIRARDGAVVRDNDNRSTAMSLLYAGYHPVRALFADAAQFDLSWKSAAPRRSAPTQAPDLCGKTRPAQPAYGAFEDFAACRQPAP